MKNKYFDQGKDGRSYFWSKPFESEKGWVATALPVQISNPGWLLSEIQATDTAAEASNRLRAKVEQIEESR